MFANQTVFNNPHSRMQALGMDTRPDKAVVNSSGQPLFYAQTGGMIHPMRRELKVGEVLFRFVARGTTPKNAVLGGWWVEHEQFAKISRFAQAKNVSVAMAARILCCVPPEWSNMGMLVRARVCEPLLAYRGLGNHVSTPAKDNLGNVKMTAHNDLEARRLFQLYIPGLASVAQKSQDKVLPGAMMLEETFAISEQDASKGWLYLV